MTQANNPLHGIKLEALLTDLVEYYGWEELGDRIDVRCFKNDPSMKSSLRFLRKTLWAREKVEYLYLKMNKLPLPAHKPRDDGYQASDKTRRAANDKTAAKQSKDSNDDAQVNANIWGN
ncbi:VF530 family protein [Shewanella sp. D64]|uniref:VF530 family protein n=1 Tax=unclassified Shewanella TaxID=196818 RepID=UPI0022BA3A5F|nr:MULTISPECIES: VF530 family protein [unclassified Shewanella]MEC4725975.1 VF530 family protein [Shewanella sp. D64]MEC4737230.1 VF530 family protein [Shewanella sp. E94]WBJ93609.1 VF530 family protein [Shewanella sp. MTB7]